MSAQEDVLFRLEGMVGVLTLNRPERLNALSNKMMVRAAEIVARAVEQRSVRALVVTGAGKGFCSGADLGADAKLESLGDTLGKSMRSGVNAFVGQLTEAPFPVITAVNGPAAGAGVGIALAGDFLIGARSMRLLLSFARIGMAMDGGASLSLQRLLGPRRAMAAAMLMDPIDAQTALEWGLASRIVQDEELMTTAMSLAIRLTQGAPLALAAIKAQVREAARMSMAETLEFEAAIQSELIKSDDVKEGVAAYRERRPAQFKGR